MNKLKHVIMRSYSSALHSLIETQSVRLPLLQSNVSGTSTSNRTLFARFRSRSKESFEEGKVNPSLHHLIL